MKNICLIFIVLSCNLFSQEINTGWKRITPLPGHLPLRDYNIFFVNEKTGWIYVDKTILKTKDGGASWNPVVNEVISDESFNSYMRFLFRDENFWMLSNNSGIYFTEDAGNSWEEIPDISSPLFKILEDGTFVLGNYREMYFLKDGGTTWNIQKNNWIEFVDSVFNADPEFQNNSSKFSYSAGPFINSEIWFFVVSTYSKGRLVFRTEDGGTTWTEMDFGPLLYFTSWGVGPESSPYFLTRSTLIYSSDTGGTWRITPVDSLFISNLKVKRYWFTTSQTVWAMSPDKDSDYNYYNGYEVYGNSIYKSTNAGLTWEKATEINSINIVNLYFISEKIGWAVDIRGSVFRTQDGGNTWVNMDNRQFPLLNDVFFTAPDNGWATSEGNILITNNKGGNWTPVYTNSTDIYSKISVVENKIWGVGNDTNKNIFVFKYDIDDFSFSKETLTQISSNPVDIHFVSSSRGLLLCQNGDLYLTTNSGLSWEKHNYTNETVINSRHGGFVMKFLNANMGWILANYDRGWYQLLKTEDGGITWKVIQDSKLGPILGYDCSACPNYGINFDFLTDSLGWLTISGTFSSIHRFLTEDGGNTWSADGHIYVSTTSEKIISAVIQEIPENGGWRNGVFLSNTKELPQSLSNLTWANPQVDVTKIFVSDENNVWALGEGMLFYNSNTELVNITSKLPSGVTTVKVSPNPIRNSTTISFPNTNQNADIFIYNVNGRKVKQFKNIRKNQIIWNANGFENGIYVLIVNSANKTYHKKLTLVD